MRYEGVIRGYTVLYLQHHDRKDIAVMVRIKLEKQTDNCFDCFEPAVQRHHEFKAYYLRTGDSDYVLHLEHLDHH